MKYILNFILTLIICSAANGQTDDLQFTAINENYNWKVTSRSGLDSFYYNLKPIETSDKKIHIRISLSNQIIDIFSVDEKTYEGFLTNFITEYRYKKIKREDYERIAKQEVYEKLDLDRDKVEFVIDSLLSSGQFEIPTDSLIPNWDNWTWHCSSIHFQHKINEQYNSQNYYCPWVQEDSTAYKHIIIENHDLIKEIFNLDSLDSEFIDKLPGGKTYSKGHYTITKIKMTDEQAEIWKRDKPKRDYLKSVSDTIDSYINAELKKQNIKLDEIKCYENYYVIFGTDGKLAEVKVSKYNKPKLKNSIGLGGFFADIREVRKCKSKIREIFQEIDLSFINARCELFRTFSFDNKGEFQLNR